MKVLVFDTETTGFSETDFIVQLSYIFYDDATHQVMESTTETNNNDKVSYFVEEEPQIRGSGGLLENLEKTKDVHNVDLTKIISLSEEEHERRNLKVHLLNFIEKYNMCNVLVAHNIEYDVKMLLGSISKVLDQTWNFKLSDIEIDMIERFYYNMKIEHKLFDTMNGAENILRHQVNEMPKSLATRGITLTKAKEKTSPSSRTIEYFEKRIYKNSETMFILFRDISEGELHNALVDIAVTLRNYVYMTSGVDVLNPPHDVNVPSKTQIYLRDLIKPAVIDEEEHLIDSVVHDLINGVFKYTHKSRKSKRKTKKERHRANSMTEFDERKKQQSLNRSVNMKKSSMKIRSI